MGDVSPFANFCTAASPEEEAAACSHSCSAFGGSAGSPRRVVGFDRSASSGDGLPRASSCATAERQGSLGGLNQLFREQRQQAEAPRPRLTIATTRSLRLNSTRVRLVPRIQEDAELAAGAGGGVGGVDLLGTTAPSQALPNGMTRSCSGSIQVPHRWVLKMVVLGCLISGRRTLTAQRRQTLPGRKAGS